MSISAEDSVSEGDDISEVDSVDTDDPTINKMTSSKEANREEEPVPPNQNFRSPSQPEKGDQKQNNRISFGFGKRRQSPPLNNQRQSNSRPSRQEDQKKSLMIPPINYQIYANREPSVPDDLREVNLSDIGPSKLSRHDLARLTKIAAAAKKDALQDEDFPSEPVSQPSRESYTERRRSSFQYYRRSSLIGRQHSDDSSVLRELCLKLFDAAFVGNIYEIEEIIDDGAEVNFADEFATTALHLAVLCETGGCTTALLNAGADANAQNIRGLTPLHLACKAGRISQIIELLEYNADVNAYSPSGTPLHISAKYRHVQLVKELLLRGADPNARNREQETPLIVSVSYGDEQWAPVVAELVAGGANPELGDRSGRKPLHAAVENGFIQSVQELLKSHANPNAITLQGETPLHVGAEKGKLDCVALLIKNGGNPNLRCNHGYLPLHTAAAFNQLGVMRLLLGHGSNPNARTTKMDSTPLHLAAVENNVECLKELIKYKAVLNITNSLGNTPLIDASRHGSVDCLRILISFGADVNITNNEGNTALHDAATEGRMAKADCLAELLKSGADPNKKNIHGLTALHFASKYGKELCVKELIKSDSDVNSQSETGDTPLHMAVRSRRASTVQQLLNDADVNVKNINDETVLHTAAAKGIHYLIGSLITRGSEVNAKDKTNATPLQKATLKKNGKTVNALLKHGAKPDSDLVDAAIKSGDSETVKTMLATKPDLTTPEDSETPPILEMAKNYPNQPDLIKEALDTGINEESEMNLGVLSSGKEGSKQMDAVMTIIVTQDTDELVRHPILDTFINQKWERARILTYLQPIVLSAFLVCLILFYSSFPWILRSLWMSIVILGSILLYVEFQIAYRWGLFFNRHNVLRLLCITLPLIMTLIDPYRKFSIIQDIITVLCVPLFLYTLTSWALISAVAWKQLYQLVSAHAFYAMAYVAVVILYIGKRFLPFSSNKPKVGEVIDIKKGVEIANTFQNIPGLFLILAVAVITTLISLVRYIFSFEPHIKDDEVLGIMLAQRSRQLAQYEGALPPSFTDIDINTNYRTKSMSLMQRFSRSSESAEQSISAILKRESAREIDRQRSKSKVEGLGSGEITRPRSKSKVEKVGSDVRF